MTESRQGHPRRSLFFRVQGESRLAPAWPRVARATLIAVAVTFAERVLKLDTYSLTATPFTIMGVAISFFLGFRNNTAYTRFWEARTLWGRLINTSRSFARQTLTQIVPPDAPDSAGADRTALDKGVTASNQAVQTFQDGVVQGIIGYARALRHHLRDTDPFPDLAGCFSPEEIGWLRGQSNVPLAIVQLLARCLQAARRQGWVGDMELLILEGSLTQFTDIQGGCERIKNTPIPVTYAQLSHRIVAFFCYALPFGIFESAKLLTPLVVFLVSYAFFGLDTLGEEIADPFGTEPHDLPLPVFAETIEKNLRELLTARELPYSSLFE
jgi:putative membrane protein